jgi:hypothetical protein
MQSMSWKTVAEFIGITAIVVSLVFVGIQVQQDRDLSQVSTYGSVLESANALSELVQNHSEVWVRGLNGEELTDAEMAIFVSIVRAVESRYMNFMIRWRASGDASFDPEVHARNFAYYIYMYPGLRKAVQDQAELAQYRTAALEKPSTEPPLFKRALPYLKQLDEAAPELPGNRTFIIW